MIPLISLCEPVGPPDAPLLVLGPSLGTSTEVWDGASAALRSRFRVAAWDLPGHGRSAPATAGFTMGGLADGVATALDGLGERQALYAGVSLGGAVGLELAVRHGSRFKAVSIVCSGAVIGTPDGWRERAAAARRDGTVSLTEGSANRWFAPGSRERIPDVAARLLSSLADFDDESYALCCEALAEYDVRSLLAGVSLPVQAIWGAHDIVTPEASSRNIVAGVQDGELAEVKDAGHLAPAECPAEVAGLLDEFFSRRAVAA